MQWQSVDYRNFRLSTRYLPCKSECPLKKTSGQSDLATTLDSAQRLVNTKSAEIRRNKQMALNTVTNPLAFNARL
jgi:hypothetical protein